MLDLVPADDTAAVGELEVDEPLTIDDELALVVHAIPPADPRPKNLATMPAAAITIIAKPNAGK